MAILTGAQETKAVNYWKAYLADVERCQFPRYDNDSGEEQDGSLFLDVEIQCVQELQRRASGNPAIIPTLLRAAWSIILHCFTGLEDVCFEYGEGERSTKEWSEVSTSSLGLANLTRMKFNGDLALRDIVERARVDYLDGLAYGPARTNNTEVEVLHQSKKQLYNTAILMWRDLDMKSVKSGRGVLPQTMSFENASEVCTLSELPCR